MFIQRGGQSLSFYAVYDEDACTTNSYQLRLVNDSLRLLTYSLHSLNSTPCIYYAGNICVSCDTANGRLIMAWFHAQLLRAFFTCNTMQQFQAFQQKLHATIAHKTTSKVAVQLLHKNCMQ